MKTGRPKNLDSPEQLWGLFEEYAKEVKANPRTIEKATPSGKVVKERLEVPLTFVGFELYCWDKVGTIHQYFENPDPTYSDFLGICSRIKKAIRNDQIAGGMVGQYNASITQRLNGLTEKTENRNINTEVPLFPDKND